MKRFVIRNYGPSRQFPFEDQAICISNDQAIETDDEQIAEALKKHNAVHVTDRGVRELTEQKTIEQKVNSKNDSPSDDTIIEDVDGTENVYEIQYNDMTVSELKELAKDRDIKTSGLRKQDLIGALEAYDVSDVDELDEDANEDSELEEE